ncbi:hypothetical protein FKM82_006872 [Ascaphus truei]
MPPKVTIIIAVIFLLISLSVIIAIAYVQIHNEQALSPGLKYGIVLDAGSSRTTVYVYQWPAEKENNTGIVSQTFNCNKNIWRAWVRPHGAETTGALDLGGASTQISFIPEKSEQNPNSTVEVTLYGYQYNVYTHSFQCYGRDEAEKRLLASIAQNPPVKLHVENPCYPHNYMVNLTMKHTFGSLCSAPFRPANYNPDHLISFRGTGDPVLCRQKVASLFNFTACYGDKDCSFDGVHQPKVKGKFSAFSGFYYTANALNLTGYFSLNEFNASMWSFCTQDWSKLPQILLRFEEKYARSYCFSANYIYYLLVHGYKFDTESWPQIHFQKEVGNSSLAWSLGYMLNLTNMIPAESPKILPPMSPSVFAGLLFLFTAISVLCLIFLVILLIRAW